MPAETPNKKVWEQEVRSTMSHTRGADYPGQPVRSAGYACFDSICADHALRCYFVAQRRHEIASSCTRCEVLYFILLQRAVLHRRKHVSEWYHFADQWLGLQGTVI